MTSNMTIELGAKSLGERISDEISRLNEPWTNGLQIKTPSTRCNFSTRPKTCDNTTPHHNNVFFWTSMWNSVGAARCTL